MGKIFSAVFGGSGSSRQSEQRSWNNAWPALNETFSPVTKFAGEAGGLMSRLLNGDASGFNAFKGATGFDFAQDEGTKGILTNLRAQGLGNSGAALKALSKFNTGLQDQYAGNYFQKLLGLGNLGTTAGGILSDAGRESKGTETGSSYEHKGLTSLGGIGKMLGGLF